MRAIARELTRARVLTAWDRHPQRGRAKKVSRGEWAQGTIHRILTNTAYTGVTYFDKHRTVSREVVQTARGHKTREQRRAQPCQTWITIAIPAIIDEATFYAAQAQLTRNRALSFRNGHEAHTYLLRGRWFRCGRCGRTMTGFTVRTHRYYRCTSSAVELDPARRCRGSVRADNVEPRVWTAVIQILDHPELVAAEAAKRQASLHEQEAAITQELGVIEKGLAKCDREERLWADAYANEAISVTELKVYRSGIGDRRREWERQRLECERRRETMHQVVHQVASLVDYCGRVRNRLRTFSPEEQQTAFNALALKVRWVPGEEKDFRIEASIPLESIASQPSVLVSFINNNRAAGMSTEEACLEAGYPLAPHLGQLDHHARRPTADCLRLGRS
jgi:site-specific DNA recombinase